MAVKKLILNEQERNFYAVRPVQFIQDTIGAVPDRFQCEMLRAVPDLRDRRLRSKGDGTVRHGLAVRSGQGVGKTACLAWITIWWLYVHPTAKIPITSTKREQLSDNLWPEMNRWILRSKLRADYVWAKEKVFLVGREELNFAVARTGSTQETLQGYHDDFLLIIVEEASGVDDVVFEPLEGTLTNEEAVLVMAGNPTRASGHFFDAFHRDKPWFATMHIPQVRADGSLHPRIAADHVSRIKAKYGENSNYYRIRVMGEFPAADPDALIPWDIVNAAVGRKVEHSDLYRPVWGVDVAYFGNDNSTLAKRQGRKLMEPIKTWNHMDNVQLAGAIIREYEDTAEDLRPHAIYVDVIGYGAGVKDILREAELPVHGVNVAESASSSSMFNRRRDELWWRTREWFMAQDCSMPNDEALIDELTTPKYEHTMHGQIRVEKKEEMKKRLPERGSPDRADALCLTFSLGRDLMTDKAAQASVYDNSRKNAARSGGTTYMSY